MYICSDFQKGLKRFLFKYFKIEAQLIISLNAFELCVHSASINKNSINFSQRIKHFCSNNKQHFLDLF